MGNTLLARIAMRLASCSGDSARTDELHGHLSDAIANGQPVALADVGSLSVLVGRRAVRDIPWWIAGLPASMILLLALAMTHETQFMAWDMISASEHPRTEATERWMLAVTGIGIAAVITSLIAGRVAVQELRRGRILSPISLVATLLIGASQSDLYVERTPWWRDEGLRPEHVNELPVHGVAVFTAISVIPLLYLAVVWLKNRTWSHEPAEAYVDADLDPVALAAAGIPILLRFGGIPVLVLGLMFTWLARSFSTRLKVAATVALLAPLFTAFVWTTVLSLELDDGHPVVIYSVLGSLIVVWLRMAVVALRPLRSLRLRVAIEHKS